MSRYPKPQRVQSIYIKLGLDNCCRSIEFVASKTIKQIWKARQRPGQFYSQVDRQLLDRVVEWPDLFQPYLSIVWKISLGVCCAADKRTMKRLFQQVRQQRSDGHKHSKVSSFYALNYSFLSKCFPVTHSSAGAPL